ncbi:hypothetical protein PPYR_01383 [Photinus pyralis]|uniref:Uncharacterized protein n=3 Tax=Photinus pyralis TaxID=7054 RepID=A0A5N4B4D5_PHOPY|nr:uncharacterized protein LOC116159288 isoform X1 [Photinus pyralis]KAB0804413.1 hypothetical protein PPYR_01383 [Photinus pyralis]
MVGRLLASMNRPTRRAQLLVKLARLEEKGHTVPIDNKKQEDGGVGYESSPAPSPEDFDSDDSFGDPQYMPNDSDPQAESSSDSFVSDVCEEPEKMKINIISDITIKGPALDCSTLKNDDRARDTVPETNYFTNNEVISAGARVSCMSSVRKTKKRTMCQYCKTDVTNFERHLERNHRDEKEVLDFLSYPKKHQERKKILNVIRNSGHFLEYLRGNVKPKYNHNTKNKKYFPCSRCKALLTKEYLSRHKKRCVLKDAGGKQNQLSASQTLIATALDRNNTLSKLRVKQEVFSHMKADLISLIVKTDPLIFSFGENYLKKHKREQLVSVCSNKMRELARFVIEFRKCTNNSRLNLQDTLKPQLFDVAIECAKNVGGYDCEKKTYRAPSLSAHIGTSLKQVCELYMRLLLKEDKSINCTNKEERLKDAKRFKDLIESQWTTEISSLAFKDLHEKQWQKPSILPLTKDILKFKEYVTDVANKSMAVLKTNPENKKELTNLIHASLVLTILFNRKRIGDVQYTYLKTYTDHRVGLNQEECINALSESEKALTKYYKRIVTGGKGSRPIAVLFPLNLQTYIDFFVKIRLEGNLVPHNNPYLFGCPNTEKWTKADVVFRKFATNANLEFPAHISSNKLRKQIATVMQILNLTKEESEQFAQFMGHTEKTHNEFYKLPQDVYQTAKISKLLLLMDKGVNTFQGKALNEIDIDPHVELAEAESDNDEIQWTPPSPCKSQDEPDEKSKKSKLTGRTPWTEAQSLLVKNHFKKHIRLKQAPKKNECIEFMEKHPTIFQNKDWVRVKTFVYNTYRK